MVSLFLAEPLAVFFRIEEELRQDFLIVVRTIGVITALTFFGNVFSAIVIAYERFVIHNLAGIIPDVIRFVLIIALLNRGLGIRGLAIATLASVGLRALIMVVVCHKAVPLARFRCGTSTWSCSGL